MKIVFVSTVLATLIAAAIAGIIQPIFAADTTYLTWVTTGIAIFGTFAPNEWRDWLIKHGITIMLGLLGTVIGFWGALHGLKIDDDIIMQSGVSTALTTTIVGMVAHLYLIIVQRIS